MSMKSMNVNGMKSMVCRFTMTKVKKTQTCGYVCVVFFSVCGGCFSPNSVLCFRALSTLSGDRPQAPPLTLRPGCYLSLLAVSFFSAA